MMVAKSRGSSGKNVTPGLAQTRTEAGIGNLAGGAGISASYPPHGFAFSRLWREKFLTFPKFVERHFQKRPGAGFQNPRNLMSTCQRHISSLFHPPCKMVSWVL